LDRWVAGFWGESVSLERDTLVVLSLASAGDKQVQLSLFEDGAGIQFGLKNHGIIRKKVRDARIWDVVIGGTSSLSSVA
jgi:hypothetical protein